MPSGQRWPEPGEKIYYRGKAWLPLPVGVTIMFHQERTFEVVDIDSTERGVGVLVALVEERASFECVINGEDLDAYIDEHNADAAISRAEWERSW